MDFLGLGKLWSTLIVVGAVIGAIGGVYWYVNDTAYNRGYRNRDAEAMAIIAKDKKAVVQNAAEHQRMTQDEIDAEWRKRCLAAPGGSAETCK